MLKPDGIQRGLIGECISRFEHKGLKLVGLKFLRMSPEQAADLYGEHAGKPFYAPLVAFVTSGPVVTMVWEGERAVQMVRTVVGATDPLEAEPGSIRSTFAMDKSYNVIHAASNPESAAREMGIFFDDSELVTWDSCAVGWVYKRT
jgi:nucleoside-diphosphate kinase